MSNGPIRRIFRNRHVWWLSYALGFSIVVVLFIVYAFAKRERVLDWPSGANFDWARELDSTYAASKPETAFTVVGIRYINGELYASCVYKNTNPNRIASVQGVIGSYGRFWPTVTLEVTNVSPPRWQRIGKSPRLSGKIETRAVAPGQSVMINVNLDPYRALIRKYRYARLVTETGASGVFELRNLLPPCEKWPSGMDCLPTAPEPELSPIPESSEDK
jgi:hypothetical protein